MITSYILSAYWTFAVMALFASLVGAIIVATIDASHVYHPPMVPQP